MPRSGCQQVDLILKEFAALLMKLERITESSRLNPPPTPT